MKRQELFSAGTQGYFKYRIPALVTTASGTILAFCEGRIYNGHDDDEIDIVLRRSGDGGREACGGLSSAGRVEEGGEEDEGAEDPYLLTVGVSRRLPGGSRSCDGSGEEAGPGG